MDRADDSPYLEAPVLQHLVELRLEVAPAIHLGRTLEGRRRVVTIRSGSFTGGRLRGSVVGGADWLTVHEDGTVEQDVRALLRCADGEIVGIRYRGLRHGPAEVMARLERGEQLDPYGYTFFTTPIFEARTDGPYCDLNRATCAGRGHRTATGVAYSIYQFADTER